MRWLLAIVVITGCATRTTPDEPFWRAPLARCEAGDAQACARVYREYRGAISAAYLREPAQRAASLSCARGHVEACTALRWIVEEGPARGEVVAKACRLGDAESCFDLARGYQMGDTWLGIARDPASAATYAIAACKLGDEVGCRMPLSLVRLGALTASAEVREEYMRLALCRHRKERCELVLAEFYAGETMARDLVDLPRANALLERACADGDAVACTKQAALVHRGRGVAADRERGLALWQRACDGGDREGCFLLGRAYLVRDARYDASKAGAAFTTACGDDATCLATAGRILAIKRERGAAAEQLGRACELGSKRACIDRGRVLVLAKRRANPHIPELERACDGKERTACYALGHAYRHGLGVRADAKRAARYTKRGSALRPSSRYWAALRRASDGKGDGADDALLAGSAGFVFPLVVAGLFSVGPDRWDFSEAQYGDP